MKPSDKIENSSQNPEEFQKGKGKEEIGSNYHELKVLIIFCLLWFGMTSLKSLQASGPEQTTQNNIALHAAQKIEQGINDSIVALENWMLLGKEEYKHQRASAWVNHIVPSFRLIKQMSYDTANPLSRDELSIIEDKLTLFRNYQKEIETAMDSTPESQTMFKKASYPANSMIENITKMIDLEKHQAATDRKLVFGAMADFRGSMTMCIESLGAYLLTKDPAFIDQYKAFWNANEQSFADLQNQTELMTEEQHAAFQSLKRLREQFTGLPERIFLIGGHSDEHLAKTLLGDKINPTASELKTRLRDLVKQQLI